MKENLKMIYQKDMEYLLLLMEVDMKEILKMGISKVMVLISF